MRDPDFRARGGASHPAGSRSASTPRTGRVAVEGWAQTSTLTAEDLGRRFEDAGVAAIIYTDIARDGVLKGLNIPMTLALARAVSIPVIASGGLASMADIERLRRARLRRARRRDHRAGARAARSTTGAIDRAGRSARADAGEIASEDQVASPWASNSNGHGIHESC